MQIKKESLPNLLDFEEDIRQLDESKRLLGLTCLYMHLMDEPAYEIAAPDQPAVEAVHRIFALGGAECEEFLENIMYGITGACEQPRLTFYGKRFPTQVKKFRDLAFGYKQVLDKMVKQALRVEEFRKKQPVEDLRVYVD